MATTNTFERIERKPVVVTTGPAFSWVFPYIGSNGLSDPEENSSPIHIGHLDTGIHSNAKELLGRLQASVAFDENGMLSKKLFGEDQTGHGTRTASLLVGGSRSRMYIGVAPNAELVSGKVLEGGSSIIRILKGLNWLADQKVPIALLCVGLPNKNPVFSAMLRQLRKENMLVICSIGNSGNGHFFQPGDDPSVLSVGAVDKNGKVPKFSGSRRGRFSTQVLAPDILAPGVDVPCATLTGGRAPYSGTSMAAAITAGVAALLLEAERESTADQLYDAICYGSISLETENKKHARCGTLNVKTALAYLRKHKNDKPKTPPKRVPLEKAGWRDPRLKYQIKHAETNVIITGVYIFQPNTEITLWENNTREFLNKMIQKTTNTTIEYLPRGRAFILSALATVHQILIAAPEITYASAADAGRILIPNKTIS